MTGLDQNIRFLVYDLYRFRYIVVTAFMVINIVAVVIGLSWPKTYTSSSTIFVEEKNIIQPLMQDAAVATTIVDRARIAQQILFSRRIMDQVLSIGGWVKDGASDLDKERLSDALMKATTVVSVGKNLVKISVRDNDPQRAFVTAKAFVDIFIKESLGTQAQESQAAFEFIDRQVTEYHSKLTGAEQALKDFRSQHIDARPGTESAVAARIGTLQAAIEKSSLELKEAHIRKVSIEKQLSGEAEVTASVSREGQLVARVAELQTQLDALRLSYHDTYPDIVRLKNQVADLKEQVLQERQRREEVRNKVRSGDQPLVDDSVRINPIYQRLRSDLLSTNTEIETLSTRVNEYQKRMEEEISRARRVHGGEADLAELTRDYEVNRDIYQDLLRRREKARVSNNLNEDKRNLTVRIQEPAALPLQPSGLRFLHFVFAGLILGTLLPPGILQAWQQVNPWVRSPLLISDTLRLPVLSVIPHLSTPSENQAVLRSLNVVTILTFVTFGFVVTAATLRFLAII